MITIGMACANDYQGVYFTVQALRMYQAVCEGDEILVVDNCPDSEDGRLTKQFIEGWVPGGRYIPYTAQRSTAVRGVVFKEAANPFVLCLDCHVLLWPDAIAKLKNYFAHQPATEDLLLGPFLHDDLRRPCTHMDPIWRHAMYGVWSRAWRCPCGHRLVAIDRGEGEQLGYRTLGDFNSAPPVTRCQSCERELPAPMWSGHEAVLEQAGLVQLGADPDDEPFEIPMQGLAAFASTKRAWRGFHKMFQGFGCEEWYIAEKTRRAGGRAMCLPFLRWVHRFNRPGGHGTGSSAEHKVWNYMMAHLEFGLDPRPMLDHFGEFHPPRERWYALAVHAATHCAAVDGRLPKPRGTVNHAEELAGASG